MNSVPFVDSKASLVAFILTLKERCSLVSITWPKYSTDFIINFVFICENPADSDWHTTFIKLCD